MCWPSISYFAAALAPAGCNSCGLSTHRWEIAASSAAFEGLTEALPQCSRFPFRAGDVRVLHGPVPPRMSGKLLEPWSEGAGIAVGAVRAWTGGVCSQR